MLRQKSVPLAIAICAAWVGALGTSPVLALPKITTVAAKCICGCEGTGSGTVPLVQFTAPGGDPNACGNQNGTQCKANGKGGKLTDCVGRVTDERISTTGVLQHGITVKTEPVK